MSGSDERVSKIGVAMFIRPPAAEERKGVPPTVRVEVSSLDRVYRPELDDELFEQAARDALVVALENGFGSLSFVGVDEFVVPDSSGGIAFVYTFTFQAYSPVGGGNESA